MSTKVKINKKTLNYFKSLLINNVETAGIIDFNDTDFERALFVQGEEARVIVPDDWEVNYHTHPFMFVEKDETQLNLIGYPSDTDLLNTILSKQTSQTHLLFTVSGIYEIKPSKISKIKINISIEKSFKKEYYKKIEELYDKYTNQIPLFIIFDSPIEDKYKYSIVKKEKYIDNLFENETDRIDKILETLKNKKKLDDKSIEDISKDIDFFLEYLDRLDLYRNFFYSLLDDNYTSWSLKKLKEVQYNFGKDLTKWINLLNLPIECNFYTYDKDLILKIIPYEPDEKNKNIIKIFNHKK